jgi:hypothetical protein
MSLRTLVLIALLACLALATPAESQESAATALWTGANAGTVASPGTVQEHAGERVAGDVLLEAQFVHGRTGRLTADWSVRESTSEFRITAGTPMYAASVGVPIRVAVDGYEPPPSPEPAPDSIYWVAELPTSRLVWFFRTSTGEVYYNPNSVGRVLKAPSMQNAAMAGPPPEITEERVDFAPFVFSLILDSFDDSGFTLRRSYRRGSESESYASAPQPWDQPFNASNFDGRVVRLSPVRDSTGAIRAAQVAITR